MGKKRVIFFIFLFLIVVCAVIIFKVSADLNKETEIKNEVKEISKVFLLSNIEDETVNEVLERRIIKNGEYTDIENSIKLYYKSLYSDLKNLAFLLDPDSFSNYLSAKNIYDDGPQFLKSRSNLSNVKAQIKEYYDKITKSLSSNTYKLSFLNADTKKYYTDFYLELADLAIADNFEEILKSEYDNALNNIEIYSQAFDFLYANRDEYEVKNNNLVFNDATIGDEYIRIKAELDKTKKEKEEKQE